MTNAEANAARPKEQAPRADQQSNLSSDVVHNLYGSMSDLTKSDQSKPGPDWLPKSDVILPAAGSQKSSNSSLADFLQFSKLPWEGGKDTIPYGLGGEAKTKPGSAAGEGNPETINPNSAPDDLSGVPGQGKSTKPSDRASIMESLDGTLSNRARNMLGDEGIAKPKGDVPGPGSQPPSGEPDEHLRNPLADMKTPAARPDVPILGGGTRNADRDETTPGDNHDSAAHTAVESEPSVQSGSADNVRNKAGKQQLSKAEIPEQEVEFPRKTDDLRRPDDRVEEGPKKDVPSEAAIKHAADVLISRGDLGNEYQRSQVRELYREAMERGPLAVAELTRAINKELERRGSDMRVNAEMDITRIPSYFDSDGRGVRLDVMKGSQKVDEMRIVPLPIFRYPTYPGDRFQVRPKQ